MAPVDGGAHMRPTTERHRDGTAAWDSQSISCQTSRAAPVASSGRKVGKSFPNCIRNSLRRGGKAYEGHEFK
jgi:hypothetical protein